MEYWLALVKILVVIMFIIVGEFTKYGNASYFLAHVSFKVFS